jgi:hypothetical protein
MRFSSFKVYLLLLVSSLPGFAEWDLPLVRLSVHSRAPNISPLSMKIYDGNLLYGFVLDSFIQIEIKFRYA